MKVGERMKVGEILVHAPKFLGSKRSVGHICLGKPLPYHLLEFWSPKRFVLKSSGVKPECWLTWCHNSLSMPSRTTDAYPRNKAVIRSSLGGSMLGQKNAHLLEEGSA